MTLAAIVALMLALAPDASPATLARHAEAIASATSDVDETIALVVIDFAETSCRSGRLPFGAVTMPHVRDATLPDVAAWVVGVMHTAQRQAPCIGWWRRVFAFYVTGTCIDSAEGARRGRIMRRLARLQ